MSTIDTLMQRNRAFAAQHFVAGLSISPSLRTMIVTCADPRVDPALLLGLAPGEAVVLRNVGGRITPDILQQMRMLLQVPTGNNTNAGNGDNAFNLIVVHHTDCGITRLARNPAMMAEYFGVAPEDLPAKAILDPQASVAVDVAALRAIPFLPNAMVVSGMVYDVANGLVDVVVPPTSRSIDPAE